jgi:hypothetical protein
LQPSPPNRCRLQKEVTSDGPDDKPARHELPFALVVERKKGAPVGSFLPELLSDTPGCHAVPETKARLILAK